MKDRQLLRRISRRQLLGWALLISGGGVLGGCRREEKSSGASPPSDKTQARPGSETALAALLETPRRLILEKIAALIDLGLSRDALRVALVAAWAGREGDLHGGLVLHAMLALERELSPDRGLVALLRACDEVVAYRERSRPLPARPELPSALMGISRRELVLHTRGAFARLDADALRLGVRSLYKRWGQEVVSAELLRMAARDDGSEGHGTQLVVAGLDMLRVVRWKGADAVLDRLAEGLQPSNARGRPISDRARAAFAEQLRMVREIGEGWQGGVRRLEYSRAFRRAARQERGEVLVGRVREALENKVHVDALWDGLALAAADMALRDPSPSGSGVHALLLVAALRESAVRAPTPQSRLVALLGAAWRLPAYRPSGAAAPTPVALSEGDGVTRVVASRRALRAEAIREAAGAGGAPSLAVRDGMRELLLTKVWVEPHRLSVPIAITRLAAVCAPPLQGSLLAAVAACGPTSSTADWGRLREAEGLAKRLRGD